MTRTTELGPGPEFDEIRKMIGYPGHGISYIGDDAALLATRDSERLVVSTDTSVENVHFKREWMTFEEIGYRATAAALSDLAAMGASPIGIVVAYAVPRTENAALEDLARGAGAAAKASGTLIVGGDVSSSNTITVTPTVFGTTRRPLLRGGARAGDFIYVTGTLGGPALALKAFQSNKQPSHEARDRFVRPSPRIREALWLSDAGASACIDISDGLGGDLWHIASASCVQLDIVLDDIPRMAGLSGEDSLGCGEEYELCVTVPTELDTQEFENRFGIPLTRVGTVTPSATPKVNFIGAAGVSTFKAFNHFSNDHL